MAVAGSNRSLVAHLCFFVKDSHTELDMSGAEDKAVVTRYPHTIAHTQRGEKAVTSEVSSMKVVVAGSHSRRAKFQKKKELRINHTRTLPDYNELS